MVDIVEKSSNTLAFAIDDFVVSSGVAYGAGDSINAL